MKKITIAIDGFSSCGKSTMAKDLAKRIGYVYIDSGAMYRAVTLYALQNECFDGGELDVEKLRELMPTLSISFRFNPETGRPDTYINKVYVEDKIRTMEVSSRVSVVSAIDFVRAAMTAQQQEMGKAKGIVMDGRDIGTTVFPDAEMKIYLIASAEVRAERRFKELQAKGENASFEEILENVKQRDYIDMHREISPLRQAEDAIVLDNSEMSIPEQNAWLYQKYVEIAGE